MGLKDLLFASPFNMSKDKGVRSPLQEKARLKYLSQAKNYSYARANPNSTLIKSYWNAVYCNHTYLVDGENKLTSKYCKVRWCMKCARIQSAIWQNGYGPQLETFESPYLVTLTAPTVAFDKLEEELRIYSARWQKMRNNIKNASKAFTAQHGQFNGLKKTEVTISKGKYHPHIHIMVNGLAQAEKLISMWLRLSPTSDPQAQDMRPAQSGSIQEMFKYITKMSFKDDPHQGDPVLLDGIFRAFHGKRAFGTFGNIKFVKEEIDEDLIPTLNLPDGLYGSFYSWQVGVKDYVSEYGEMLTGYEPSARDYKSIERLLKYGLPPDVHPKESYAPNLARQRKKEVIQKGYIPDKQQVIIKTYLQTALFSVSLSKKKGHPPKAPPPS